MISFLSLHRRKLFIAVIVIFLLGTFVGLGGYLLTDRDMGQTVASVGSTKIPYSRFTTQVNQYLDALRSRNADVSDAMVKEVKVEILRDMIVNELLLVKAEEMGITISDAELARDIRSTPAFQAGGEFSPEAYYRAVRTVFRDTPQGYEEMRRRVMKASRVKQIIFESAKISPAELAELYAKERKGSLKGFAKEKDEFVRKAQQARYLELINASLRQMGSQLEVRTFLEQRESGT